MTVETKAITITGWDTAGTNFGRPAYLHFIWVALSLLFLCLGKRWAHKAALVFVAFNLAWATRNFFLLTVCQMGECPVRRIGLYILFTASLLLLVSVLLSPALGKTKA